jgi:hypothetical protein
MTIHEVLVPANAPDSAPLFDARVPANCNPRIATLLRYWLMKRPQPPTLPGRQHIWPAEIIGLLRNIWLCDVQRQPLRFRYRLIGSMISYMMEHDATGQWLDDVHPGFMLSPAYTDFMEAVETRAPAYYKGAPMFHLEKDYLWMERLLLPLARDGREVDMLLGITLYGPQRDASLSDADSANA